MKRDFHILEEDEYAMGLSNVIERDFFPELQNLRDTKEYLEAERLDDQRKVQEILFRKRQKAGADQTPYGNEEEEEEEGGKKRSSATVPAGLSSVDAYLGTYTSEDNASFVVLQQEELKKRREKDVWGKRQAQLHALEAEKKMLLIGDGSKEKAPTLALEYKNQQLMNIVPEHSSDLYEKQLIKAAAASRERVVDAKNTRFDPKELKAAEEALAEAKKKHPNVRKRKKLSEIVNKNRFLDGNNNQMEQVDLDDFFTPNEDEDNEDNGEPNVNGFGFISTPHIVPGVGVDESPLVSWGTVDILKVDTKGKHFQIPAVPERDKVAQKLTESVSYSSEKMRQRGATPILGKSPVFSPAGQKLLEQRKKSLSMQSPFFRSPIGTPSSVSLSRKTSSSSVFLTPKIKPKDKK